MREKIRILLLSTNIRNSGRNVVDDETTEIFERLHEGPHHAKFQCHKHSVLRPGDLQKLLLMYEPHIVHFGGRGSQLSRLLIGKTRGRDNTVDHQGLARIFALYSSHVRLVLLNSCFGKAQARSISEVIDYSIGSAAATSDKVGVTFAGAFYRALAFGKSVRAAFELATAELALMRLPRSRGIELFVRNGVSERDRFPGIVKPPRRRIRLNWRYRRRCGRTVSTRLHHVAR